MKRVFLLAALIIISLQAKLYAQSALAQQMARSKTDQTFNLTDFRLSKRDFVVLKEGKMTLDLLSVDDYSSFRNLDSLLTGFMKDIAFYRDSLNADPTGHVRIDYVLSEDYSFKKIRFKRYHSDGDIYVDRDGEIAKLKFDYDTVRIIIQKSRPGLGSAKTRPCFINYAIQATFLLGSYTDINKVIADKVLGNIVDTLQKTTPNRKHHELDQHTIVYNPYYAGQNRYHRYNSRMASEYITAEYKRPKISFNPQFGAAVVRSTLAPVADIGFQYNNYWDNNKEREVIRLSGKSYYFFDKQDEKGNYIINDNWFINLSYATIADRHYTGWFGKEGSFGIGYLVSQKGNYFKGNTFRMFTDIMFVNGLTISPEVIFADNFKQVFPGITVKVL